MVEANCFAAPTASCDIDDRNPASRALRTGNLVLAVFVAAYLAWNYGMVAVCVWFGTNGWIAPFDVALIVLACVSLLVATTLLLLRRWRGAVVMMVLAGEFAVGACGRPERPVPVSEEERPDIARYRLEERMRMSAGLALVVAGIAIAGLQATRRRRRQPWRRCGPSAPP